MCSASPVARVFADVKTTDDVVATLAGAAAGGDFAP
jgi:hypothetical protein